MEAHSQPREKKRTAQIYVWKIMATDSSISESTPYYAIKISSSFWLRLLKSYNSARCLMKVNDGLISQADHASVKKDSQSWGLNGMPFSKA